MKGDAEQQTPQTCLKNSERYVEYWESDVHCMRHLENVCLCRREYLGQKKHLKCATTKV